MKKSLEEFEAFKQVASNCKDPIEILDDFCELIKKHLSINHLDATGVYIGKIEKLKKKISDEDNDTAHIDESAPTIIHYVATCKDHQFMIGIKTKVSEGISYEIFKESEEQPPEGASTTNENEEEAAKLKEELENKKEEIKTLFIPEVVREPKIKYYRVPKLGSYLVVALCYTSFLFEDALDKAVENYYATQEKISTQQREKEDKEAEIQKQKEDAEEEGTEFVPEKIEWEVITEPPYLSIVQQYILCIDTLGQDRQISQKEIEYVKDIAKFFCKNWEEREKSQLEHDKLQKVKIDKFMEEYNEKEFEPIKDNIEKQVEDAFTALPQEMPEADRTNQSNLYRVKGYAKIFLSGSIYDQTTELVDNCVIKYPRIIQNLYYILGYEREMICEAETNKLSWKKSKEFFNIDLFKKMNEYNPMGPKEGKYPKYRLLNSIERSLGEIKEEDLLQYSVVFYYIYKWIKEAIELRKQDIANRMAKREMKKQEREEAIKQSEERKQRRDEALQAAIEEAKAEWNALHPPEEEKIENKEEKAEKEEKVSKARPQKVKEDEGEGEGEGEGDGEEKEKEKKEGEGGEKEGEGEGEGKEEGENKLEEQKNEEEEKKEVPVFSFNNEEFLAKWDQENPDIEIPPEVIADKDDDYEVELK